MEECTFPCTWCPLPCGWSWSETCWGTPRSLIVLWFEGDFVPLVVVDNVTDDNQDKGDSDGNLEDDFVDDGYDESSSGDALYLIEARWRICASVKYTVIGSAPNQYFIEYRHIVNWALRNKLQWHFVHNSHALRKMLLKVSSAEWWPFCLGRDVLSNLFVTAWLHWLLCWLCIFPLLLLSVYCFSPVKIRLINECRFEIILYFVLANNFDELIMFSFHDILWLYVNKIMTIYALNALFYSLPKHIMIDIKQTMLGGSGFNISIINFAMTIS